MTSLLRGIAVCLLLALTHVQPGATQPRCFTDIQCQGASLPEAGDTCCRVPAAQRYLPTTAGAQQCLPCFTYGWVREEPEGSEMYIRQETITAEEGETVPLTIYFTKNANLFADAFFFYIGTAGTATLGQDYDLIQEGNILLLFRDPVSVNVTLRRDNVAGEPTETIILTLMHNINFPPVENEIQLYSTVIINVQDQDVVIGFEETMFIVDESAGSVDVNVTVLAGIDVLTEGIISNVVVRLYSQDGTAVAPGDYTSIDMMLTFDSGNIQITVPVEIVEDGIHENAEELSVHLSIAIGVNVTTSPEETTIQIVECPELPDPPNGMVSWTSLTVGGVANYMCSDGFELVGNMMRTCQSNNVWSGEEPMCRPLCPDLVDPVNGMVMMTGNSIGDTATYSCNQGYELVGAEILTCQSIGAQWSDSPPECKIIDVTINLEVPDSEVVESVGAVIVRVTLSAPFPKDIDFVIGTIPGTANGGVDYGMEDVSGSIPVGQTEAVVSVPIVNDNELEQIRENFRVALRNIILDGLIIGTDTIIVTILDDDLVIGFEETMFIVDESAGSVDVNVLVLAGIDVLTEGIISNVVIRLYSQDGTAVAPGDYTSIDMMLTFDSGNIQITVPVGIVDDGIHENAEELSVHLSIANGVNVATSPEETTIQIVDNAITSDGNSTASPATDQDRGSSTDSGGIIGCGVAAALVLLLCGLIIVVAVIVYRQRMVIKTLRGSNTAPSAGHVEMDMIAEYASVPIDLKRYNTPKPCQVVEARGDERQKKRSEVHRLC